VRPDERMVGAIDDDQLRPGDAVVQHPRVVDRFPRSSEPATTSVGQASSVRRSLLSNAIVSLHEAHQPAALIRHEPDEPVRTVPAELPCGL
jgi:hypothetical protein